MNGEVVVRVHRGAAVESEHRVAWAVAGGEELGPSVFVRSAAKPFQALSGVRRGVPDRLGLGADHLAVACASHGGGDAHVVRVRELLRAAGCAEPDLGCGPAEPRDPVAAAAHRDAGGRPEAVRHNCSGKHAFALALAVAEGWPVAGYYGAGHPVQAAMCRGVAEATGVEDGELPTPSTAAGCRPSPCRWRGLRTRSGGLRAAASGRRARSWRRR